MITSSGDTTQARYREVERLLGRCLLQLQRYERLTRAVIKYHDISGSLNDSKRIPAGEAVARKTLGTLIRELCGSYLVADEIGAPVDHATDAAEDIVSFRFRVQLRLPSAEYAKAIDELKELVELRNSLVHSFLDQHDLQSLDGCRRAQDALECAYGRIDQHYNRLREWADDLEQCRRLAAEFVQSDQFRDLAVNGMASDDGVDRPDPGIVSALREAALELAVDGWVAVAAASKWIAVRYPEQVPAKYGCRTWPQVVQESRVFEIRKLEMSGRRSACYREKRTQGK